MLTEEQKAKIQQKESETPDALKRDSLTNYREGWFHVTLNVHGEAPVLGYITGNVDAPDGCANAPRCVLTELGLKVEEEWRGIGRYYSDCVCEEIQIMPEHIHALMHLLPANKVHLGRIINGLMIGCTHAYWNTIGTDWREMRRQIDEALKRKTKAENNTTSSNIKEYGKELRAEWQDRDHTHSFRGPALFVRGYNDVEAIGEDEIETKRQYILNNPRKRLIQRTQHACFHIHRQQHTHSWTLQVAMQAIAHDRFFSSEPDKCQQAQRLSMQRLNIDNFKQRPLSSIQPTERLGLDWIGNPEWMASERKLPLVCHRRDAWQFEKQKQATIDKVREGWVIVSAFISPKEREIKEQLMREQLPFVEIMDNGFAERYKPTGKAFYACAENRLVQITPWTYQYDRNTQVSREQCLVMNQLARVISGKADDWWK